MTSSLRFRKLCFTEPTSRTSYESSKLEKRQEKRWGCVNSCCWFIGCMCTTWWLLLFLYHCWPAGLKDPQSPGVRLKNEGLTAAHPVVLVPGMITGGLELWEGRPCSRGLFRKQLWGGTFTEIFKRPLCWLEHLSLDNETGLDPPGIRVRPIPGLIGADYFAPGYFVWAVLIENLANIGYEGKNMYLATYDWRLSFQNTEIRDQSLSRLKLNIELMYVTNGNKKVVVVPHSMGVTYFLHFLKWVEAPPPMGGGGGPRWCAKYIKSIMNIGPAFLGIPKAVSTMFSAEGREIAFIRAMDPGLLDSEILGLKTMEHIMRMSRTWDSIISLLPKGGEPVWGDLDSAPEDGHECDFERKTYFQPNSSNHRTKYGRIISFGKTASQQNSSKLHKNDPMEVIQAISSATCGEVWTEYGEINWKIFRN